MFRKTMLSMSVIEHFSDGSSGQTIYEELTTVKDFTAALDDFTQTYNEFQQKKAEEAMYREEIIAEHQQDFPEDVDYEPAFLGARRQSCALALSGTLKGRRDFAKSFSDPEELKNFLVCQGLVKPVAEKQVVVSDARLGV